jgi:hypothetical protein
MGRPNSANTPREEVSRPPIGEVFDEFGYFGALEKTRTTVFTGRALADFRK